MTRRAAGMGAVSPATSGHATSGQASGGQAASGIAVILSVTLVMALQDGWVKIISSQMPLWQFQTLRSVFSLILLAGVMAIMGRRSEFRLNLSGWVSLRSGLIALTYILFFAAFPVLDYSTAVSAYYTGPLFITVLSVLVAGERAGWHRIAGVTAGFVGVLLVVRPQDGDVAWAVLAPVAAAFFYALATVVTRSRCGHYSTYGLCLTMHVWFVGTGLLATAAIALWNPTAAESAVYPFLLGDWVAFDGWDWLFMGTVGVSGIVIHLGLAWVYQERPSSMIAPFEYATLIFAAIFGVVVFSETLTVLSVAGMALIAGGGLFIAWREGRGMRAKIM